MAKQKENSSVPEVKKNTTVFKDGDSLAKIATDNGLSVGKLQKLNDKVSFKDGDVIKLGE